jgi:hypothetical protein
VRELVIVIPDLFLDPSGESRAREAARAFPDLPGFERSARFGSRHALAHGWRGFLAAHVQRPELADLAPARIAQAARTDVSGALAAGTAWIASPVHLSAGLTRVHLAHGGLLRLTGEESEALEAGFARTFGGADAQLTALAGGELLLHTPALAAFATSEPARLAGGMVSEVLPASAAAAPLRRLMAEIEMWLHAEPLNALRARRGVLPVTALWPWGADGARGEPVRRAVPGLPEAFGRDAWLSGLYALCAGAPVALPGAFEELAPPRDGCGAVLLVSVADELQRCGEASAAQALARLDARFVSPALRSLASGALAAVTLVLNDTAVRVRRASRLRLWRRRRLGLEGFA